MRQWPCVHCLMGSTTQDSQPNRDVRPDAIGCVDVDDGGASWFIDDGLLVR